MDGGQIFVNVDKTASPDGVVELDLMGAELTNTKNSPIYVESIGDEVQLVAKSGTVNTISDGTSYTNADSDCGAVYSKDDLKIKGSGSLSISTTGTGIAAFNLIIEGGNLTITTAGTGISCDYMEVNGGSVTVNAQGKGVYCNYGNTITAGTLKVTSQGRAIDVFEGGVNIDGGKVEVESTGDDGINVESSVHITDGLLWAKGAYEGVDMLGIQGNIFVR